jgi:hypothetical protein
MTPPAATLVVALPTVDGREHHLDRAMRALEQTTPADVRLIVEVRRNRPTCGEVWNLVAQVARGFARYATDAPTYLLCMADDLEPLPGWFECARMLVDEGSTPSALIFNGETGHVESHGDWAVKYHNPTVVGMSRIPFCRAEQWIDIPPIHYFSDNAFSSAITSQGVPIVAHPDYAFRHWWAQEHRHPMNDEQWFREQTTWQTWAMTLLPAPRYL